MLALDGPSGPARSKIGHYPNAPNTSLLTHPKAFGYH